MPSLGIFIKIFLVVTTVFLWSLKAEEWWHFDALLQLRFWAKICEDRLSICLRKMTLPKTLDKELSNLKTWHHIISVFTCHSHLGQQTMSSDKVSTLFPLYLGDHKIVHFRFPWTHRYAGWYVAKLRWVWYLNLAEQTAQRSADKIDWIVMLDRSYGCKIIWM